MSRKLDVTDLSSLVENVPTEYQEDVKLISYNMMRQEAYNNSE